MKLEDKLASLKALAENGAFGVEFQEYTHIECEDLLKLIAIVEAATAWRAVAGKYQCSHGQKVTPLELEKRKACGEALAELEKELKLGGER